MYVCMYNIDDIHEVSPPTNIRASSLRANIINFTFEASQSPDIVQYAVKCVESGCEETIVSSN